MDLGGPAHSPIYSVIFRAQISESLYPGRSEYRRSSKMRIASCTTTCKVTPTLRRYSNASIQALQRSYRPDAWRVLPENTV